MNPRQYYALIQDVATSNLINRDVQGTALQSGQGIMEIAGIKIYKSMNVPFFSKYGTKYGNATDFANTCGLVFQREAAGCVEAIGPQVQVTSGDISVVYQGDVILGRLAMGADFLNPAACVELFAGTTTKPAAFGATFPANG